MSSPLLLPSLAFLAGAAAGARFDGGGELWLGLGAVALVATLSLGWRRPQYVRFGAVVVLLAIGGALAGRARQEALHPSIRGILEREFGGFDIDTVGVGGNHDPVPTRILLDEDAAYGEQFTTLRGRAIAVQIRGTWEPADGGIIVTVGGRMSTGQAMQWLAGRTLELPLAYGRPATYLNEGVPDFERDLALDGTALFGSAKSALLVDVVRRGGYMAESAARVRLYTRSAVQQWVGRYSSLSAGIVTAILIGDRTGLPDEERTRLQAAGTYHVIAISGGNIAILAALVVGALMLAGASSRMAAAGTMLVLIAYAEVVASGASVWRATVMAVVYLFARALDHRTSPWHAMSVAALLVVAARPLDVRDAGFLLTFGATAALLEVARRTSRISRLSFAMRWLVGGVVASLAAEVALAPVAATAFSRVTAAGVVLNLIAVPVMTVTQVAGMTLVIATWLPWAAHPAGWIAHEGASLLVSSARLIDVAPWLAASVPRPSAVVVAGYYAGLLVLLWQRGTARVAGAAVWCAAVGLIVFGGARAPFIPRSAPHVLRLTMFDVGQGDGMLLELPDGSTVMIDAGGAPFGSGAFDIGGRVLAPALWARGARSLAALLVTHGDPDHVGGAASVLEGFRPGQLWEGIPVPSNEALADLHARARARHVPLTTLHAGASWMNGAVRVRVLHPEAPDWERPRVRNDDSVVLEVLYGDVALLLTGDIGVDVERTILPQLTPARIRILKVPHHGSRTSSSRALLEAWRPQIALISAGRGNRFGHPAPDVVARYESIGARIYRTDRDGEITVTSDGRSVQVKTFTGGER